MPGLHSRVITAADSILRAAADEADSFITQATENLHEAKTYYRQATTREEYVRENMRKEIDILDKRAREVWIAEERYNNSCKLDKCKKCTKFLCFHVALSVFFLSLLFRFEMS